ncbi:manganese transport protein [Haloactinopolyspora alba]|uniref:Manganese transport protein n=1 Tax=Haloactinopolyspora alba TaxID=648780 RepID=A0A2P8EFW6_9ACTN|nr:Nramp family divalent metal transporter [Haloactinopolyspora alba]PSL08361.1 manganese transport protein [Haloactinopolyspora alba]
MRSGEFGPPKKSVRPSETRPGDTPASDGAGGRPPRRRPHGLGLSLLGPAFVAAVAYVDPGNVATNLSAGAGYGYLLVWVLALATAMAGLVQYLSAKLGVVTGESLPQVLRERMPRGGRIAYWLQAEVVAVATDIAEVVGGAIALRLLFGVPLPLGGVITGVVSMAMLSVQNRGGQRMFERVITFALVVIAVGFVAGLVVAPPDAGDVAGGLVPRFDGTETVLLAAGMFGATVMPHVVYLHSALARDRFGASDDAGRLGRILAATRLDVGVAMVVAGGVNIAMLLSAAAALRGADDTDTIAGAHAAVDARLGVVVGALFAVGLLVSGLASTSVGCYAGAVIMEGLLLRRIPLLLRRTITLTPAVLILGTGAEPTWMLVLSQVVLSFGIPFAVVPLVVLTARRSVMGAWANTRLTTLLAAVIAVVVVTLNIALLWLTLTGA